MIPTALRGAAGFGLANLVFGGHRIILWTAVALAVGGAVGTWLVRRATAAPCLRCVENARRQRIPEHRTYVPVARPIRRRPNPYLREVR
jgi:hypothetical protein